MRDHNKKSVNKKITKDSSANNSSNKKIIIDEGITNKINILNDPIRKRKEVNVCNNINITSPYIHTKKQTKTILKRYKANFLLSTCN